MWGVEKPTKTLAHSRTQVMPLDLITSLSKQLVEVGYTKLKTQKLFSVWIQMKPSNTRTNMGLLLKIRTSKSTYHLGEKPISLNSTTLVHMNTNIVKAKS